MVICVFLQLLAIPVYESIVGECGVVGCNRELFVEALGFICVCGGMEFVEFNGVGVCWFWFLVLCCDCIPQFVCVDSAV